MYRLVEAGYVKALYPIRCSTPSSLGGGSRWSSCLVRPRVALNLLHRPRRIDRKTIERPVDQEGGRLSDFTLDAIDQGSPGRVSGRLLQRATHAIRKLNHN